MGGGESIRGVGWYVSQDSSLIDHIMSIAIRSSTSCDVDIDRIRIPQYRAGRPKTPPPPPLSPPEPLQERSPTRRESCR